MNPHPPIDGLRTIAPPPKPRPASHAAFLQAILDAEGLTLAEQKKALHDALSAVIRKQMQIAHERNVT
jgi:hypothetical protein